MRRAHLLVVALPLTVGACSLFLDSGEFSSEDDKGDAGPSEGGSASDGASWSETSTTSDSGEAGADGGDDFCTRSFAGALHFDPFDLVPTARWSRPHTEANASIVKIDGDGNPAPGVSFQTSSGIPADSFMTAWLEKDLPVGKTYRLGFDVKVATQALSGRIAVARFELSSPNAAVVTNYTLSLFHGFIESAVEHRYELKAGGVEFRTNDGLTPGSDKWVSYRVELALGALSDGRSRLRVCRDGVLVSETPLDFLLETPVVEPAPVFDIGIAYSSVPQPPLDIRFDNAFAEVVP